MILDATILEVLADGGFTSPFVDFFGDQQPAPVTQKMYFDELETNERILLVRSGGGSGGNKFVQRIPATIAFFGRRDKADVSTVSDYADRIVTYLLEVHEKCGIIYIDPIVGASSVMFTDSGRPVVEIQTTVLLDRGLN